MCEEQLRVPGSEAKRSTLTRLDTDHLVSVLRLLPVQDVLSFRATCSHYREVASRDIVWEFICCRDWGADVSQVAATRNGKWMEFYRELDTLKSATWRKVKQLGGGVPKARANHSLRVLGTKLVLFGGGHNLGQCLDDTWITDPKELLTSQGSEVSVKWALLGSKEPPARFGQSCSLVGDALVMFGGINVDGQRLCDTWTFSLGEGANGSIGWHLLPVATSPPPRGAHGGCYAGRKRIVVFGGINTETERLSDTWLLNLEDAMPTWREIPQASNKTGPCARAGHTLTWIGDSRVLLFGGRGKKLDVLNDTWVLDLEAEFPEWVELLPRRQSATLFQGGAPASCDGLLPPPRAGHSGTLIAGGRVLILGGEDEFRVRKSDMWVLDPSVAIPLTNSVAAEVRVPAQSTMGIGRLRRRVEEEDEEAQVVPSGDVSGQTGGDVDVVMDEREGFGATGGARERPSEGTQQGSIGNPRGEAQNRMPVTKRQLWTKLRVATDEGPGRRSFHAACTLGHGLGVLVFGGWIDGPPPGTELAFDDEMFVLQLVPP